MKSFAIATALLSAAVLLSDTAQGIEIQQFDKMASEDKGEYVSGMVGGAEQVFKDEGRADLAAKVEDLFTRTLPGDQIAVGIGEVHLHLARARVADLRNLEKNPPHIGLKLKMRCL